MVASGRYLARLLFEGAAMSLEVVKRDWDVVIIGAGLGGGSAGRRLAEMGLSVLFLEKGPLGENASTDVRGRDHGEGDL